MRARRAGSALSTGGSGTRCSRPSRAPIRGGRACLAGWLGGLDPIAGFDPLLQMRRTA